MIEDLDKTLAELLQRELPQELVGPDAATRVNISFATPDGDFPPPAVTLPAIDLFLYDIRENRELRSNEWLVERRGGNVAAKKRSPARVDCSYLVTAWTGGSSDTSQAQKEHRLLGEVLKVLLRHPVVPAEVLQGSLRGQEPPLPSISLQSSLLQSLGEFWQALGGKPKAALSYTVTIGVDVHKETEVGLVTEKMIKFKLEKEVDL
jgi:hypothetical protein